jgi:hypothetical protein
MTTTMAQDVGSSPQKNLNILSLGQYSFMVKIERLLTAMVDAGGPQGLSQLMILKRVMESLSRSSGAESGEVVKRPCEVFHAIGGAGTGG